MKGRQIMKKTIRALSLILAAILSVGIFAACDGEEEKIPTIEEIFQTLEKSENAKLSLILELEGSEYGTSMYVKVTTDVETDGDRAHSIASMTMNLSGKEFYSYETEMYSKVDGNSGTVYMKDEDTGEWQSTTVSLAEAGMDPGEFASQYQDLFNPEYFGEFDKETGRYTMTEGTRITLDDTGLLDGFETLGDYDFFDAYIEVGDGSYTVFAKFSVASNASGTLTLTYSDIGQVTVTLPEGVEG